MLINHLVVLGQILPLLLDYSMDWVDVISQSRQITIYVLYKHGVWCLFRLSLFVHRLYMGYAIICVEVMWDSHVFCSDDWTRVNLPSDHWQVRSHAVTLTVPRDIMTHVLLLVTTALTRRDIVQMLLVLIHLVSKGILDLHDALWIRGVLPANRRTQW